MGCRAVRVLGHKGDLDMGLGRSRRGAALELESGDFGGGSCGLGVRMFNLGQNV